MIEAATTRAAEQETQSSFGRLTHTATFLIWIMMIGAIVGTSASLGVYHFALATRKANIELRSTRTFLDTVIENVPAMLAVKEPREQRYILINRAGEQLLGIPREDLIGKTDYDLYPREEAEAFIARDRKLLGGDRSETAIQITPRHHGPRWGASRWPRTYATKPRGKNDRNPAVVQG